jgi:Uma2 family endonuclease
MNAVQEVIRQNKAELMSLVLEALPEVFVQNQVVPKDKETELREKERRNGVTKKIELIDPEKQIEIANGEVELKEMAGAKAGGVAARIIIEVGYYLKTNKLGRVYTPDTTFTIGKNQRMPDVSFVSAKRIPKRGEPSGKWKIAPDLAVEVVSPTDSVKKVRGRLSEFFAAGIKEVWIVEPEVGVLSLYHEPIKPTTIFTKKDVLTGSIILPEFNLELSDIFID